MLASMGLGVLLTYYNERELLTECLHSLRNQAHPPDEIWIYDDASKYSAFDYVPEGMDVKIVRALANRGPAYGRNQLLHSAQSDYVHFHDADDLFLPGWAQTVRRLMAVNRPDMILTELNSWKGDAPYRERFLGLSEIAEHGDLTRFAIEHAILPAAGTYRRAFVVAAGGYREDLWQSEDYEFHIRLAAAGARFNAHLEPLVRVRVRNESRSQKLKEVWAGRLKGLTMLQRVLVPKYQPFIAHALAQTGSQLHQAGSYWLAHRAFRLSRRQVRPTYSDRSPLYAPVATFFGGGFAEWVACVCRFLLPASLRRRLRA